MSSNLCRVLTIIFQLFENHQSSSLKSILYLTCSRSFSPRNSLHYESFSSESSNSSNRSPLISADSYAVSPSFTFVTCNTQRGQLWIVADLFTCNPNKSVVIIAVNNKSTVVIVWWRESRRYPFASMPIAQSSISRPSPPTKKGILFQSIYI